MSYRNVSRNLPLKTYRVYFRRGEPEYWPVEHVDIRAERPESAAALAFIDKRLPRPFAVEELTRSEIISAAKRQALADITKGWS